MVSNSDGSIILSVKIDTAGAKNELEKLRSGLSSGSNGMNSFKNSTSKVTVALGAFAKAVGIAFSVAQIAKFSNEASKSAMQQESSILRIAQIYGEAGNKVQEFVDKSSAALGMSKVEAYKAAASYGNLFSSFADSADNAQLTNQMLQTTAVIASKTGRTFDEVFTKIQSGIFGNTRAIDDLGVYVNQATLQYTQAFQTIADGRAWANLTGNEQKQILTLAILEQAQARYGNTVLQSTALVQSQYNAAFADFKATWGQVVNMILVPILKTLTLIFQYATIVLRVLFGLGKKQPKIDTKVYGGLASNINNVSNAQDGMTKSTKNLSKATKELNKELAGFDTAMILYNKETFDSAGGAGGAGGGVGGVGGGVSPIEGLGEIEPIIDEETQEKLERFEKWLTEHKDEIIEIAKIIALIAAIAGLIKIIGTLLGWFKKKDEGLTAQTKKTQEEESAVSSLSPAYALAAGAVAAFIPQLAGASEESGELAGATDLVTAATGELAPSVDGVTSSLGFLIPQLLGTEERATAVTPTLQGVTAATNGVTAAVMNATSATENAGKVTDVVMPAIATTTETATKSAKGNVGKYTTFVEDSFKTYHDAVTGNQVAVADTIGNTTHDALQSAGDNTVSFLNATSGGFSTWASNVSKNIVAINTLVGVTFVGALASAWASFKSFVKATGGKIKGFFQEHKAAIAGAAIAAGITIGAIALAPYTGGASLAFTPLAEGAVLPPNKPFLAMVGDQKKGTNIEAPLDTIVQAMNIALANNNNVSSGNTEVVLEIDGREFGRAVVEQGNKENRRIGTRLVLV